MYNVLIIGDIKSATEWVEFGDIKILLESDKKLKPKFDFYVFLGDYVSELRLDKKGTIDNVQEIIRFKDKYSNNVVLLIGDSDLPLLLTEKEMKKHGVINKHLGNIIDLKELMIKHVNKFQPAFQLGNNLFSYSLITEEWIASNLNRDMLIAKPFKKSYINIADKINIAWKHKVPALFNNYIRFDSLGFVLKSPSLFYSGKDIVPDLISNTHNYIGHIFNIEKSYFIKDKYSSVTYVNVTSKRVSSEIIKIK